MSTEGKVIDLMVALERSLNGNGAEPAHLAALRDDATTGLFGDVPDDFYHAQIDRASSSRLKTLEERSAAHMRWEADHPKAPTPAKKLGTAIHLAILQPDVFHARYAIAGQCEAITGKSTRCTNSGSTRINGDHWLCGVHSRGISDAPDAVNVLEASSWDTCVGIAAAVQAHPTARALLKGAVEQTALWTDRETGLPMKGRFDVVNTDLGVLPDLKSCENAHPDAFERTIYGFKYYRQSALYLEAAEELGIPARDSVLIAFEKTEPFGVMVYRVRGDAVQAGREELKPLKERYARCRESGVWSGYPTEVRDISLPPHAWKQIDDRKERGLAV